MGVTLEDIKTLVESGKRVIIRIKEYTLLFEDNFFSDKGMIAEVTSFEWDEQDKNFVIKVKLDEFLETNRKLQTIGFYDTNNQPTQTYEQACGKIPNEETLYFCENDLNNSTIFELLDNNSAFMKYKDSGSTLGYIEWLERIVEVNHVL